MLGKTVCIPDVDDSSTSEKVLVTEWVEGRKISEVGDADLVRTIIPRGVEVFCEMLLDIGKFHADPHWGNLIINEKNQVRDVKE